MFRVVVYLGLATLLAATVRPIVSLTRQQPQPRGAVAAAAQHDSRATDSDKRDAPGAAQKPDDNIQLKAKLVSLTVTVSDRYGRFVTGLSKRNFEAFDDGVRQEIAHFSDEDAPLTLGIIYDVSGSMGDLTSRSFQALRSFFETSHQEDEYFIIAFNDRAKLVQDFTTSPSEIMSRVIFVKAKGSTALYDGVYLGIEKARQGRHQKRALLIISDGEENSSRYNGRELRELLKESDVPVYSIAISQLYAGVGTLQWLSNSSGGMTFSPADEPQTRDIYTRIALMLRHQYAIGFYPTDTATEEPWHKVRIMINAPRGLGRLSLNYKKSYRSFGK
ncbi:MAG TPA: VWA domain-containing protein [Blastocatellia bacterium]|nr:VWA domain-containing protein [Blastocatellia bacterium]